MIHIQIKGRRRGNDHSFLFLHLPQKRPNSLPEERRPIIATNTDQVCEEVHEENVYDDVCPEDSKVSPMTGKEDIEGRSQPLIRGPESAEMTVAQCIWIGDEAALLRNKLCQVRPTALT